MTENSGCTFQTPILSEDMSVVSESVGEPYQGVEAKILDKDGNVVPKGTIGELVTKGYFLFNGYLTFLYSDDI